MSKRKIMLLAVAGLVAIGTVMAARALMGPQQETSAPVPVATTQILAATHDLPTGTILKDADMKWIPWAADSDTSQFYRKDKDDTGRLVGAVLRDGMRAGEPFLTGHIVQAHDHGFLAAVLTPGMRAIAVTLSPSSGVAGFIFPGDHVDVILTHSFSRKDSADLTERRVSEIVLSDARVLALDQKTDSMSADPKVAQLATLEVTPKQAEKLALASDIVGQAGAGSHGNLSLVLRSLAADNGAATGEKSVTWDSDVSSAFPSVNGEDGLMQRVHIMRGKDATDSNFERHR